MSSLILSPPVGSSAIQTVAGKFSHRSKVDEMNLKIMSAAIVVLFLVVLFIICLHLYAKWFWRNAHLSRRRLDVDYQIDETLGQQFVGLEKAVVESLPTFKYAGESMLKTAECAVCLCEFEEMDTCRLLPKCSHTFHIQCIDTWFKSHSTCPLCRVSLLAILSAKTDSEGCPGSVDARENLLLSQSISMSYLVDFGTLDNSLIRSGNDGTHQPHTTEGNMSATALQQMQETRFASCPEGSQLPSTVESKGLNMQQSQLPSLSASQREGSIRAQSQVAIEVPRSCSETSCVICSCCDHTSCVQIPKSPLSRFSLRRILSRDRKIAPSSSASVECEEVLYPSSGEFHQLPL